MGPPPAIGAVGTTIIDAPPRGSPHSTRICRPGRSRTAARSPSGRQDLDVVPGTTPQVGQGTAKVFRYTVEVEDGLDPTMFGATTHSPDG